MAWHDGTVDPDRALRLMSVPGVNETDDPRTELLLRDMMRALSGRWGTSVLKAKMRRLGAPDALLDRIHHAPQDTRGFPTIADRTMNTTEPEAVLALLRDLGRRVRTQETLVIGGSIVLILEGFIVHATQDIDLVDELPASIRNEHDLLRELVERHRLQLTHFQSHYLPDGWRSRLRSLGRFDRIDAFVVDPIDMLVCKLFSRRSKDYRHVKEAWDQVDRDLFQDRLARSTGTFRRDEATLEAGRHNWYVLTGEPDLPAATD